ncbi:hypothetical protein FJR08_07450 [Dolichospermum sp. UHCC 0260]|nr:hypothetical protein [Dolichospermum sp. UHCC 0260]
MLVAYALIVAKNCLNQDVQYVFLIFIYIFRNCILSESGYSGFEDVQDVFLIFIYIFINCILSESGYPGFEDVQDVFLIFIYIFSNCANSSIPEYQNQI